MIDSRRSGRRESTFRRRPALLGGVVNGTTLKFLLLLAMFAVAVAVSLRAFFPRDGDIRDGVQDSPEQGPAGEREVPSAEGGSENE